MRGAQRANRVVMVIALLLMSGSAAWGSDQVNSPAGLAVYSDMGFIEDEGEYSGVQVVLVPYYDGEKSRQKVLWRSAHPFLNTPLLLDTIDDGKSLKVVVPEGNDDAGAWTLTLKGNILHASGPRSLKYSLKKITVK